MLFQQSSSPLNRRKALWTLAAVMLSLRCAGPHSERRLPPSGKIPNGMYPVIGEPVDAPPAQVPANQRVLRYDPRMADSESTEPVRFATVDMSDFVPLILASAAEHAPQESGRLLISVVLASPYVQRLADFTQAHLNHPAALVLDGEVMSIHKIRTTITGGRMQITRCDDHACQRILSKLADSYDAAGAAAPARGHP